MKTIAFASGLRLPIDAVTQTFAFLARRGGGKTYGAGKLVEGMLGVGIQVVIIDHVGVWYGLRLAADGKGKGFDIPIFGGEHGDLSLDSAAGSVVARLLVEMETPALLDVSSFRKRQRKDFITAFTEEFFHAKKTCKSPVHVVLEEAQAYAPQKVQKGEERMLGAMEDLIKLGRNYGIGVTLISQRPQAINKDVLNQTEALVVLQTSGAHERKAIREWVTYKGVEIEDLNEAMSSLSVGEAFFWSPQWLRMFRKVRIGRKKTFDSSATPEFGKKSKAPKILSPVDLEKIRTEMAGAIQKAEENDPKALKRRVRTLELELAKGAKAKVEVREVFQTPPKLKSKIRAARDLLARAESQIAEGRERIEKAVALLDEPVEEGKVSGSRTPVPRAPAATRVLPADGDDASLRKGARRILATLVSWSPVRLTKSQVATLTGFKQSGTFSTYLGQLKRKGWIEQNGKELWATEEGARAAGQDVEVPETTEEILALWRQALRAGARRMLDELVADHPSWMLKEDLAQRVEMAMSGTFSTYLGTLRRNGLAEVDGNRVRAGEALFLKEAV